MIRKTIQILLAVCSLLVIMPVHGQPDEAPPYLYYYSRMLGGLIIERADGTDSRHLAADVIPPDMTGLVGPGWSPSGRYFSAYGINYGGYYNTSLGAYLIDSDGETVVEQLSFIDGVSRIEWAPNNDLLLVIGSLFDSIPDNRPYDHHLLYWLIDPNQKAIAAEFSAFAYGTNDIIWEPEQDRIRFFIGPQNFATTNQYFEVTMMLDGTVLKEPSTREAFREHSQPSEQVSSDYYDYDGVTTSPGGIYKTHGTHPAILTNTQTGEEIEMPRHTQGTVCRTFTWSDDEQYIISLTGTLVAGGGCASAVLGVIDSEGQLWRELGGCSWDFPPCVGWLPERVDVDALPPGSSQPVQLEPVRTDDADEPTFLLGTLEVLNLRLRCDEEGNGEIVDIETDTLRYSLSDVECHERMSGDGWPVAAAYDPAHDLLVLYNDNWKTGVTIWTRRGGRRYEQIFTLNTQGFALEFTDDGDYLRARNVQAWKVYAVADILVYAGLN